MKNKEAEDCYKIILNQLDRMSALKKQFDSDMQKLQDELKAQLNKKYNSNFAPNRYKLLYDNLEKEKELNKQFDQMVEDGF